MSGWKILRGLQEALEQAKTAPLTGPEYIEGLRLVVDRDRSRVSLDAEDARIVLGYVDGLVAENKRLASAYRELAGVNAKLWRDLDAARIALGQIHTIASAPTQAPYINPGKAVEDIARTALSVSDENRNGEDPEGLRSEGLPARWHEVTDALTLSPKEQKGSDE